MRTLRAALLALSLIFASALTAQARVIFVNRADADGFQDGSSWENAYITIQDGVDDAGMGDEVWVAAGTYVENVNLHSNVALYGGFDGTEESREERNPAIHFTSIDGGGQGRCVAFDFGAGPQTVLDGFRLRNGRDDNNGGGGGVFVSNLVTGTISNNVITENTGSQGAGIAVQFGSPIIANNLIAHNTSSYGAAMVAYSGEPRDPAKDAPKIVNNTIVDNHAPGGSANAVVFAGLFGAIFGNNIVALNDKGVDAGDGSGITIASNDVVNNAGGNWTGSLDPTGDDANISADPEFADDGSDNYRVIPGSAVEDNGDSGLSAGDFDLDFQPRLQGSDADMGAYELGSGDYHLVFSTQPEGAAPGENLPTQPVVTVEDENGNRVRGYSGAVTVGIDPGAGNPDATLNGTATVNVSSGVARFNDLSVDSVGAGYVLNATTSGSAMPAQSRMFSVQGLRLYVRTDGDDGSDGASWDTAKQTIQAALDQGPEEVWVAEGTYEENLVVSSAVSLYGGFFGDETSLDDRDPDARSAVDGGGNDSVLASDTEPGLALLDGFTLMNGDAGSGKGGGAYLTNFHGTISNVEFNDNHAYDSGGGLFLESRNQSQDTDVTIENVAFRGNSAGSGGGLYVDSSDNWNLDHHIVHVSNSTFDTNVAAWGGAVFFTGREMDFEGSAAFTSNTATVGGGLYLQGFVTMQQGSFAYNGTLDAPADAAGGAVYADGGGFFSANNVTFEHNVVTAPGFAAKGGAVAAENGGGFYLFNTTLDANEAETGGGIFAGPKAFATLNHVKLSYNSARGSGGGAYFRGARVYIESSLISHNLAGTENPSGFGGGLVLDHAPLQQHPTDPSRILNATIAVNSAPAGAGMDIRNGSVARMTNSIVAFNTTGIRMDASSRMAFNNNNVAGNTSGNFQGFTGPTGTFGNISQDPMFVDSGGDDYHLKAGSPSIDAGGSGPYAWYDQDLDFLRRVQGAAVDMGAYEAAGTFALFLQWNQQPTSGDGGPGPLSQQPALNVIDSNGGVQTGFTGSVTVALKPGTGTTGAALGGTTTVPVVNGVATFTNVSIGTGGTGYALTAAAAGAVPSDSNPFNVLLPTVRVAASGEDTNDGASWASAKRTLQAAADGAQDGGAVWIAAGTYPGLLEVRGTSILGGFAGTETDPAQRVPATGATVLDADHLAEAMNVQSNEGFPLTFDRLTIRNGVTNGVQAYPDNLTFSNDTFEGNSAGFGGAMIAFSKNLRITRSRFLNNTAQYGGGGAYLGGDDSMVDNSVFAGNTCPFPGAALSFSVGTPLSLVNNTFTRNTGGATLFLYGSPATFTNNIIANNDAGISRNQGAQPTVTLSHNDVFNNTSFNYENVAAGATDISVDPLFLNPAAGDYRLGSGSAAVDAGDDTVLGLFTMDLAGNPRKIGAHVDIGALEQTAGNLYGIADAIRALKIAAGLLTATGDDIFRLNVDNAGISKDVVDTVDANHIIRKVGGAEPNP